MSRHGIEEMVSSWLEDGPRSAPGDVVERALAEARTVRQVRTLGLPSILATGQGRLLAAAAAASVFVLALIVGLWSVGNEQLPPGASPSPSPSAFPSPSADQPSSPPPAQSATPEPPPASLVSPLVTFLGQRSIETETGPATAFDLAITNWQEYPAELFAPAPELPACDSNTNAARTWIEIRDATTTAYLNRYCALHDPVELGALWFAVAADQPIPSAVYVELVDRLRGTVVRSLSLNIPISGQPTPAPAVSLEPGVPPSPSPSPILEPEGWTGPLFVSERNYWEPTLVIDADGNVHAAALLNDGIFYLTNSSGSWTRERLSRAPAQGHDREPSIALDSDGSLWVAFTRYRRTECQISCYPADSDGIYYVSGRAGDWSDPVRIGNGGNEVGSLQVDGGTIHLASVRWVDPLGFSVFYTTNSSGDWTEERLRDKGNGAQLRLGSDGLARIAFSDGPALYYATAQAATGSFTLEQAPDGFFAFLALDNADEPHIVAHVGEEEVRYMHRSGDAWTEPEPVALGGMASGIAVDDQRVAHIISRYNVGGPGVRYATNASGGIESTQLYASTADVSDVGSSPSAIGLDGAGRPHVLFMVFHEYQGVGLWYAVGPPD
jgi:hypothetical protein